MKDDKIQHGIDDNPHGDAKKGAVLGGAGGAAVGAAAGAAVGPIGAVIGAAVGGIAGAVGSGAAVGAVDKVDNDNTISGLGDGKTRDVEDKLGRATDADLPSNRTPGIQTGGRNADGSRDTRGVSEKIADTVTGDRTDDKTGKRV